MDLVREHYRQLTSNGFYLTDALTGERLSEEDCINAYLMGVQVNLSWVRPSTGETVTHYEVNIGFSGGVE